MTISTIQDSLRDYLYVDERRLDSYLQDFSSTEIAENTRPVSTTISLTPSVRGEQSTRYRPKRTREKLDELIRYCEQADTLAYERPSGYEEFRLPDLVLEQCDAARAIALPPAEAFPDAPGIAFWVSEWPLAGS